MDGISSLEGVDNDDFDVYLFLAKVKFRDVYLLVGQRSAVVPSVIDWYNLFGVINVTS